MKIYSIKDKAVGFTSTFTTENDYSALRMFSDSINTGKSMLNEHPEDFQLYRLGELNQNSGVITPEQEPKLLEEAVNLLKK